MVRFGLWVSSSAACVLAIPINISIYRSIFQAALPVAEQLQGPVFLAQLVAAGQRAEARAVEERAESAPARA